MEYSDAINLIKEYLTELWADPDIYENGKCNLIHALEDFAVPAMEKEIARDVVVENAISRRQYYACPSCADFIKWKYVNELYESDRKPDRCPGCGQLLNWE